MNRVRGCERPLVPARKFVDFYAACTSNRNHNPSLAPYHELDARGDRAFARPHPEAEIGMTVHHNLLKPFELKSLLLKNRIVMAPMTRRFSPGGIPGPDVAEYYRRRAAGDVGLIITEGTTIGRPAASNDESIPNFYDPASLDGWRKVVKKVHLAGGKIAPQLWHQGLARPMGSGPVPSAQSEGPSADQTASVAMSDEDIADTIEAFALAAAAAKKIGFDAVELHGAHGYLIDEFFWRGTNRREDAYGGDIVKRSRFATEVIKAVRSAVGPTFPISLRFSQWRIQDYSSKLAETPEQLEQLLAPLAEAGVDLFHASTRRYWEPEFPGSDLNLAGWARKLTGVPTITVGSVGLNGPDFLAGLFGKDDSKVEPATLHALEHRLEQGEFDLVAVGRALLADPDWVAKIEQGRFWDVAPFDRSLLKQLV